MTEKATRPVRPDCPDPTQVFRQFAWNIAGTLAAVKAGKKAPPPPVNAVRRAKR